MSRVWRGLAYVLLGFSVQFCGKSGGGPGTETTPPPDLPTYSAAEYDASAAEVKAVEEKLAAKGVKFVPRAGGGMTWERRPAFEAMNAEMRNNEVGLEDKIPLLEELVKALTPHVQKYGRGFFKDENGRKIWVKASEDPLKSEVQTLAAAKKSIEALKHNSFNNESTGSDVAPEGSVTTPTPNRESTVPTGNTSPSGPGSSRSVNPND